MLYIENTSLVNTKSPLKKSNRATQNKGTRLYARHFFHVSTLHLTLKTLGVETSIMGIVQIKAI
jgi:hypothetical protein